MAGDELERGSPFEPDDPRMLRDRLAAIIRSADDAIFSKDVNGLVTSWNQAAERLYGYSEAEMVGRSISAIVPPERAGEEREIVARILEGEELDHYETRRRTKEGRIVDVSISASPIHNSQGEIVGVSVIARDVSGIRATRTLSDRLAAIVDGTDDAIYSKDVNAVVDSWNRGAERLYGYSATEAIGRHVSFIVPPDLKGEETSILHRILAEERIEHHETTRLTKAGELVDVSITVSPVYDGEKVVGASVIARDVSDRRRLEDLQRRVDRTDFIARAVHDLRTPLTTLVGFAEILARRENLSPERRREIADTIARQGDQVNALLGDLLDLSYVESGRYEMSLERVALADVMTRVLETVRPPAGKEIDVEVPDDAVVIGDPSRIGQILVNLVSNAFKYGGDHVRVIARPTEARVTLEVSDDGRGVPETVRDTLFEPFTRGHTGVPGTGLGLAITSRLIAAHGGTIELVDDGPGCRFVIDLPGARDSERV